MHGGLSPDLKSLEDIKRVARPTDVPDSGLLCDLLWADPDKDIHVRVHMLEHACISVGSRHGNCAAVDGDQGSVVRPAYSRRLVQHTALLVAWRLLSMHGAPGWGCHMLNQQSAGAAAALHGLLQQQDAGAARSS